MERLLLIASLMFIVITSSCNSMKSYRNEKKLFRFEHTYNAFEPLYLSDFIIYGVSKERNHTLKTPLNDDSLFTILKTSLNKLELEITYPEEYENYGNLSYFDDEYLSFKSINKNLLYKSASKYPNQKVIFPVLLKYYKEIKYFDPSTTVYPTFYCYITLAVFVVENCEILYYKQVRHEEIVKAKNHPHTFEDYHIPISQEKWDALIQEVMKEYKTLKLDVS